jgi:CRISPR-associated protein Csm1
VTAEHNQRVFLVALAGLLHDIGKFGQRAGEEAGNRKDHASVGNKFVSRHVPRKWEPALAPVGWHHGDPDNNGRLDGLGLPVKLIALADRLSAGERDPQENEGRPKQMVSVFSRVAIKGTPRGDVGYLPLEQLSLYEANLFPKPQPDSEEDIQKMYKQLWADFCTDADILARVHESADSSLQAYLESMFHLLRRYTWSIPSAYYYAHPDVSLYSHLHVTAALGACFAKEFEREEPVDNLLNQIKGKNTENWPQSPQIATLLGGDISGIQDFIYTLHETTGATAILRARSFYIQMLVESIARYILRHLELPVTNALYVGGGGFILLVPPIGQARISELSRQINKILLRAHRGDLYFALGAAPLTPSHFGIGAISQAWGEVLPKSLQESKDQRFSELDADEMRDVFAPQGSGGDETKLCSICGQEANELVEDVENPGTRWCNACQSFRSLGDALRRARYLTLAEINEETLSEEASFSWQDTIRAFGMDASVSTKPTSKENAVVFSLDKPDNTVLGPTTAVGTHFLVSTIPIARSTEELPEQYKNDVNVGALKHFGILAQQSTGAPYLGILRMDMDNLGTIFSRGLHEYDSLSRRATLSLLTSIFFEGWVGKIADELGDNGLARLYAVYSGGDDLFFVGSWDAALNLAIRIRNDFLSFSSNKKLGISGGVVLVHEKTPLYIAARQAETAEHTAKHLRNEKDAMCFLNTPVSWEKFGFSTEENTVAYWANQLSDLVDTQRLPRTVLRVIQDLHAQHLQGQQSGRLIGPWVWRAAYWLYRANERAKDDTGKKSLRALTTLLSRESFSQNIEWLALAARWAELKTRKEDNHV